MTTIASATEQQIKTSESSMPPCLRCHGLLVKDCVDHLWLWRCVNCGDCIDPIILERRMFAAYPHRPTGLKIFGWLFDSTQKSWSAR